MSALQKTREIRGIAAPLPRMNVDTDAIMPKIHLISTRREGLGSGLFSEWRRKADGSEIEEFVLNRPPFRSAAILVAGENFGCGSSREHAVWGLLDFGIRCVIAPSFASIFHENCRKNGLAAVVLPEETVNALLASIEAAPDRETVVSIEDCTVSASDGTRYPFEMEPDRRKALLEGLDEIGMTMLNAKAIAYFQDVDRRNRPWIYGLGEK